MPHHKTDAEAILHTTGILFDLKRFAVHDGPGIRTTIFLKGCPLNCHWCHNPESRSAHPEFMAATGRRYCGSILARADGPNDNLVGREVTAEQVLAEVEKDLVFYRESGGGVTFSGGEPLNQPEFLEAMLAACRERGIHTAVDTSGHARWEDFERVLPWTDLFLYDLKLMDDAAHRRHIGVTNRIIHQNLIRLHDHGAQIHIRVPLIPGITDTQENLDEIAAYVDGLEHVAAINLLPYNPMGEGKYGRLESTNGTPAFQTQSKEALEGMKERLATRRAEVIIGG